MKAVGRGLTAVVAALLGSSPLSVNVARAIPTDGAIATRPATTLSEASSTCWTWKSAEKSFFYKINRARQLAGRTKLVLDRHLGRVSRKHTWDMASRNRLYHTSAGTLGWRVTRWYQLGENVGVGGTVESLHNAFMNSPSHRSNVLYSKFRYVGVGTTTKNGSLWVTVTFESTRDPGTRLSMPSC